MMSNKMTLKTEGDKYIVVTRHFAAPPESVYRAHIEPALIQKWMLGPEGWTMPVCINEAKPGGKIRYEWSNGKGGDFYLTGEFLELEPNRRIVHVERMHLPDPTPDNHVETIFEPDGTGTRMTMRMTLPDAQTRAAMLSTGMERGMEASYQRLERIL
ncbi:MAG TPA: SRPBCC domain-containing protein [Terriglobales bacterium]|nr:SRPBCC domain-containing protein [Terriglobales bacterium]